MCAYSLFYFYTYDNVITACTENLIGVHIFKGPLQGPNQSLMQKIAKHLCTQISHRNNVQVQEETVHFDEFYLVLFLSKGIKGKRKFWVQSWQGGTRMVSFSSWQHI